MTKHIGIVDITTVGATICARAIVEKAAEEDPSGDHPEFTMHSFSFKQYKEFLKDWSGLAHLILQSIRKLQKVGADVIIIPSNTVHYAFQLIQQESPLPILNLIDITANECKAKGYKKVAVLGTQTTMEGDLYTKPLTARDITPVIPGSALRQELHALIMDELVLGKINPTVINHIAEQLKLLDCDAYILGCTELPEVYDSKKLGKPCVDTTRLLGYEALKYAKQG